VEPIVHAAKELIDGRLFALVIEASALFISSVFNLHN